MAAFIRDRSSILDVRRNACSVAGRFDCADQDGMASDAPPIRQPIAADATAGRDGKAG
jgi:hypothetical protein